MFSPDTVLHNYQNYYKVTISREKPSWEAAVLLVDSEGFWWCITRRIMGFLDYVHRPVFYKTQNSTMFQKLGLFLSSGQDWKRLLCWVHYKELKVQWLRLALPNRPNRIGVSHPSPEDGNRYSFRNVVFYSFQNTGRCTESGNPVILTYWSSLNFRNSLVIYSSQWYWLVRFESQRHFRQLGVELWPSYFWVIACRSCQISDFQWHAAVAHHDSRKYIKCYILSTQQERA
jgi:hypothetical protein